MSHDLPNGFGQNMCHIDAFIEFWRHKADVTEHSAEFLFFNMTKFQKDFVCSLVS